MFQSCPGKKDGLRLSKLGTRGYIDYQHALLLDENLKHPIEEPSWQNWGQVAISSNNLARDRILDLNQIHRTPRRAPDNLIHAEIVRHSGEADTAELRRPAKIPDDGDGEYRGSGLCALAVAGEVVVLQRGGGELRSKPVQVLSVRLFVWYLSGQAVVTLRMEGGERRGWGNVRRSSSRF